LSDTKRQECGGFVQPYSDSPLDDDRVSEDIYMQIIGTAQRYVYIYTPYLIVGSDMMSALMLAARSGVDVRIITPHKWDKKFVHMTTRSAYRTLIEGGVKIYEYTPGFVHSKVMISDGEIAVVGTANLDYRSLYLHFECGAVFYGGECVCEIERDFLKTQEECQKIGVNDRICRAGVWGRLVNSILKMIAPLL
jgi:cardiolipin synthase